MFRNPPSVAVLAVLSSFGLSGLFGSFLSPLFCRLFCLRPFFLVLLLFLFLVFLVVFFIFFILFSLSFRRRIVFQVFLSPGHNCSAFPHHQDCYVGHFYRLLPLQYNFFPSYRHCQDYGMLDVFADVFWRFSMAFKEKRFLLGLLLLVNRIPKIVGSR